MIEIKCDGCGTLLKHSGASYQHTHNYYPNPSLLKSPRPLEVHLFIGTNDRPKSELPDLCEDCLIYFFKYGEMPPKPQTDTK